MLTALSGIWLEQPFFEHALASLFCKTEEEREKFSPLYRQFWLEKGTRIKSRSTYNNKKNIHRASQNTLVMAGLGKSKEEGVLDEGKNTSGANAKDTLKSTDFSKLTAVQSELLDELAERLVREMSLRIKRKRKRTNAGQINIGRSIRKNLQRGGNIIELFREAKQREKFRLLVLLDVSGSMDKYSYYLLKFLWSLRMHFKQIEVFTFSTKLRRITDQLDDKDIQTAFFSVSRVADHWSSGTKIGECLREFNEQYHKRYLNGSTLTLILSDGLDTGEPEILDTAIQKISMKSKRLIWLNPLKGMTGYEPIQRGMQVVLPQLNHFGAAHNLNSLLELENILIHA